MVKELAMAIIKITFIETALRPCIPMAVWMLRIIVVFSLTSNPQISPVSLDLKA